MFCQRNESGGGINGAENQPLIECELTLFSLNDFDHTWYIMAILMNTHPLSMVLSLKIMNADGSLAVENSPLQAAVDPICTSLPLFDVKTDEV